MAELSQTLTTASSPRLENLRRGLYRFRRNPLSMLGLIMLIMLLVIAVTAPVIVPFPEDAAGKVRALDRLKPPDAEFWFGTDNVGRDIFSRTLMGTGLALQVGVVIIVLATTNGVRTAGWGPRFDETVRRLVISPAP